MSSLILPHSRTRQPSHFVGGDIAQAQRFKTIWLATFNSNKTIRDVVRGHGLAHPGGLSVQGEGTVGTFNGSQAQNAALALPSGNPDTFVIAARIRATATQAGSPGAAFGIYESAAQGGVGVGFNSSNQIGAAWLSSASAGIGAYSAAALNTWYTVFVQVAKNDLNQYLTKAWINGVPATTNQGSNPGSGSSGTMNEICIGAQHRSSGYLRNFTGDILWASLLRYTGQERVSNFSFTDADALRLYRSGYPWQILRPVQRKIWVPVSSAAHLVTAGNSGQANTSSSGAIIQTHLVAAASSAQANQSSAAAVKQTHFVAAASSSQTNIASPAAIIQSTIQNVTAANGVQANTASIGAISQTHLVAAASSAQANQISAVAVKQTHLVSSANSTQANTASPGSISQDATTYVSAGNSAQANTASAGAIKQIHLVSAAPVAIDNIASASAVVQTHLISAANSAQANVASAASAFDVSGCPVVIPAARKIGSNFQAGGRPAVKSSGTRTNIQTGSRRWH